MQDLPKESKGVILDAEGELSYGSLPLPALGEKDVLIKIHSAPINPADVMFTQGTYPAGKTKPCICGLEGSGLVIAVGSDPSIQGKLNQKVSFFSSSKTHGSWGDYIVLPAEVCMAVPGELSYEELATCLVNPLTVQGFIIECENKNFKCIVHDAAASSLGKMLVPGIKTSTTGTTLINIVRRQEQVDTLKALGAEHIINTGEEDWKETASKLFAELKPEAFFDAVAGQTAADIIALLPDNAVTYNYGCLSMKPIPVSSLDLIFKGKVIKGWWLSNAMNDPATAAKLFTLGFTHLAAKIYKTEVARTLNFGDFEEALAFYADYSNRGKVLMQNPNFE